VEQVTIEQKEQTVKNFALIHSLLADGIYPGRLSGKLQMARGFIEIIHAQALKDLEADPEYKKEPNGTPPQEPTT
jgi:hypothetical protein